MFIHFSSLYFYGGLHIECRQSTRYLHDDILGIQQQQQQEKFGILKFMAFDLFCVFRFYYTRSIPPPPPPLPPPTKTYYCSSCEMFRKTDDFIYNIFTTRFYLNQHPNPPPPISLLHERTKRRLFRSLSQPTACSTLLKLPPWFPVSIGFPLLSGPSHCLSLSHSTAVAFYGVM